VALNKAQRDRLAQGWALHQQGKLLEAEKIYEAVRKQAPRDAEVLHLLGTVALRTDRAALAVDLISAALRQDPSLANAHNNLGNAFLELERPADALISFERGLKLRPGDPDMHNNRGNALLGTREFSAALADYDIAIARRPAYPEAWSNRGMALQLLERHEEALECYSRAVSLRPQFAEAHARRGKLLVVLGRHGEAIFSLRRAIALKADLLDAHLQLGIALGVLDRHPEAAECFDAALAVAPDSAEAMMGKSLALLRLHRLEDARVGFAKLVELRPDSAVAHDGLGLALNKLDRNEEALECFQRALALDPGYIKAVIHSASAIRALGNPVHALAMLDDVIHTAPEMHDAHHFRGMALWDLDRRDDALLAMDQACALKPDLADAQFNASLLMLQAGDIAGGLARYEWRKRIETPVGLRGLKTPAWLGDTPLAGRRLFIHAEQGLGDTLQFCRYLPELVAQGAQVTFAVQGPVQPLLAHLSATVTMIGEDAPAPLFDLHCPLMSVPLALGTTLATICAPIGYLRSDPARQAGWQDRLGQRPASRPRIGIAWSGNPEHPNDHNRSIPLADFQSLVQFRAQWVGVQKDLRATDAPILHALGQVQHHPTAMRDFADTAALLDLVDLVITVDTSVAHLAGALGRPVWLLLPNNPDWRWMLERDDSPWYPTMRLFRQPARGDWAGALAAVLRALLDRYGRDA
jgi:tetratricopeptide (TPR) repeat protein